MNHPFCTLKLDLFCFQIREFAHSITLFALGVKVFEPLIDLFEHDAEYKDRKWVRKSISWSQNGGYYTVKYLLAF